MKRETYRAAAVRLTVVSQVAIARAENVAHRQFICVLKWIVSVFSLFPLFFLIPPPPSNVRRV